MGEHRCPTCQCAVEPNELIRCREHSSEKRHCPYCVCPICQMNQEGNVGPTGDFPEGKLSKDDKGGLDIALGVYKNEVFMSFGAPVTWLAMPPQQMRPFAAKLMELCDQLERKEVAVLVTPDVGCDNKLPRREPH